MVRRNLEHLWAGLPVTLVEDLLVPLQTKVVGVSRSWVILLRQVATLIMDRLRVATSRGDNPGAGPYHAPKD